MKYYGFKKADARRTVQRTLRVESGQMGALYRYGNRKARRAMERMVMKDRRRA